MTQNVLWLPTGGVFRAELFQLERGRSLPLNIDKNSVDVIEVGALEQLPVVLVEKQVLLHAFYRDNEPLHDLPAHRAMHGLQVLLHLVESPHVLQVRLVFDFFPVLSDRLWT